MEYLSPNDQRVANFAPDDEKNNLVLLNIIEDAELADAQLELGEGVGAKALDRVGGRGWLVTKSCRDCGLDAPLFAGRQCAEL
jgi:hypothetical protein